MVQGGQKHRTLFGLPTMMPKLTGPGAMTYSIPVLAAAVLASAHGAAAFGSKQYNVLYFIGVWDCAYAFVCRACRLRACHGLSSESLRCRAKSWVVN